MRKILSLFLGCSTLLLTLLLSSCGGGGGDSVASPPVQPPPVQQWPQSLAFTDFTGGQDYYGLSNSFHSKVVSCYTCINLRGIAATGSELKQLLTQNTPSYWPVPYNSQPYSDLPIDYNSKMAVVLEDRYSSERNGYSIQKVEESAETITVSVIKCDAGFPLVSFSQVVSLGLLVPKSTKPIQVVTLPSTNPPVFASSQLGGC